MSRLQTRAEGLGYGVDDVKQYNLKQSVIIVVGGFILLWICLYLFVFPHLAGGGPEKIPRSRLDEEALNSALKNYQSVYAVYPTGESSNVVRILTGDNPQRIVFLNFRRTSEHPNEMVDPWGTPYQIKFLQQTNFIIRSSGKNKVSGDKDDIVFNSLSNDFVKP